VHQNGPNFARKRQKRRGFWLKSSGFSGFVFTDEYIWVFDEDVYYLLLAWMNTSQESGFEGGGVGVPLFSSPFDRFSFATTPSTLIACGESRKRQILSLRG
jgi:hypothetical protein